MNSDEKKEKIAQLISKNILVSPELLSEIEKNGYAEVSPEGLILEEGKKEQKEDCPETTVPPAAAGSAAVKVLSSYDKKPQKRGVQDFISYFNSRYSSIEKLLTNRQGLSNLTSIGRIKGRPSDNVSFIGAVYEKQATKSGNILLSLEDRTGSIKAVVNSGKKDVFETAQELVHDEIVGVTGSIRNDILFVNALILPDIMANSFLKKSPYEGYAVFLSDMHVGSEMFLSNEFERFIKWICGNQGTEQQRAIASKVKYLFLAGDAVDGVGVYPNQQYELSIKDIYGQYKACAELLSRIPQRIKIIICPGNHDATRISEPQPPFSSEFTSALTKLPNIITVSNPSLVNIDSSSTFPGINVLLYHGYSFDYYVANVDSIRQKGGYDRADLIMKFLLKRRHLAPSHTSTLYIPDAEADPLFIDAVPDIFATGHLHKTSVSHYRGVTLISGSCWQSKTPFQEKLGHKPEPARVPVVNLQTRDVKILKFGSD
ncbi:DNA-directed DNA polymerase II small subunit [Candidatus Woesearchaeota archaeon]|nr:DNA-directed DNA polymerase II small subunit [Candidatus Woesearchaeota archaeon]